MLIVTVLFFFEFLSITKLLPNYLYFGLRLVLIIMFLVCSLKKNNKEFKRYFYICVTIFIVESFEYINNFSRFIRFEAHIIPTVLCFGYAMLGNYIYKYMHLKYKIIISYIVTMLAIVTSITTLIGLVDDPFAVRALGNGNAGMLYDTSFYYMKNMASWGMVYSFVFLLPALVHNYQSSREKIFLFATIVTEVMIISSQIMFAIIISIGLLFFSIFNISLHKDVAKITIAIFVFYMLFFIFKEDLFFSVMDVLSNIEYDKIALRFTQVYLLVDSGIATGDADARFDLYMTSINTFLENPLFGYDESREIMYKNIGMHSQIFDLLAAVGLFLGGVWIVALLYLILDIIYTIFDEKVRELFVVIVISLFILMLLNPVEHNPEIFLMIFILPSIMNVKKKNEHISVLE